MSKKRIVVKVGSNVLTRENGKLDITRMSALVDQTAWLHALGYEVILVSSGAMASGRGEISVSRRLDSVAQRQLFSALGQAKLINHYYNLFKEYRLPVGQVLTMKENFNSRRAYLNQRACMEVMLENGVIPIVNENDTVSVTELMFTDNDELSGLIASMMGADALVILSNIDGIYDGPPDDPASNLIGHVKPGSDLSAYIQSGRSGFGRGGMVTKYNIAKKVAEEGIRVIIANGKRDNILVDLQERPDSTPHTEFEPTAAGVTGIKKWIAHSDSFAKGRLIINERACEALCGRHAVSLLLVGVTQVEGDFEEGDLVGIYDEDGRKLAVGRTSYDSESARRLTGCHDQKPIVHYDYLYME
ncbi:MAG: glutamate 5-kinase [Prevotella sp.]|nr:glutamate 5-kinase [Prevotella sp.]